MIYWHQHHIIPRHMGGTDDRNNLLKCNAACHAFLHKLLWEEHGNQYDRIAWQCLSGQITNEEANIMATKHANTGKTPWNKGKKGVQVSTRKGVPRSEETKKKCSEASKKAYENVSKFGRKKGSIPWNKGKKKGSISAPSSLL
jgi:hypothetical protein